MWRERKAEMVYQGSIMNLSNMIWTTDAGLLYVDGTAFLLQTYEEETPREGGRYCKIHYGSELIDDCSAQYPLRTVALTKNGGYTITRAEPYQQRHDPDSPDGGWVLDVCSLPWEGSGLSFRYKFDASDPRRFIHWCSGAVSEYGCCVEVLPRCSMDPHIWKGYFAANAFLCDGQQVRRMGYFVDKHSETPEALRQLMLRALKGSYQTTAAELRALFDECGKADAADYLMLWTLNGDEVKQMLFRREDLL